MGRSKPVGSSPIEIIPEGVIVTGEPIELVTRCLAFQPDRVRADLKLSHRRKFNWNECEEATFEASRLLAKILKGYDEVTYRVVFSAVTTENGEPLGHMWLETKVCGETFVTDLLIGDPAAESMEFGALFAYQQDPYFGERLGVYESTDPIDPKNSLYQAERNKAWAEIDRRKGDNKEALGIEREPWWVEFSRWIDRTF